MQNITDSSETGCITEFENTFVLQKVALDDFERRIKKLVDSSVGDEVTEKQLIECFKDSPTLNTFADETSLLRKLLTHPCLHKDG